MKALMELRLSSPEMDTATWVQILEEAVCISLRVNTLEKDLNPTVSLTVGQTGLFNLEMATDQGEGKLWTC